MAAKVEKNKVSELSAYAFYTLLKTRLEDDSLYAGVSYIPDSDWNLYAGSLDSESTFWGGTDSDYGILDKTFYAQSMYSIHKAFKGGISRVVPRVDWTYGETYKAYPDDKSFALVKDYESGYVSLNVYRCLHSPKRPSYYAPSGISNEPFELSDGYVWKYMYTITNSQSLRFLNDKWMPVPEKIAGSEFPSITSDSPNYNQYVSQVNAESGVVRDVVIDSDTLIQTVMNDSDLRVAFNWSSVELIGLDNRLNTPSNHFRIQLIWDSENSHFETKTVQAGKGYVGPVSIHLDSDLPAISGLSAFVSPGEGHGSDVPAELKASNIMISVRNLPDETSNVVYDGSNYNLISLLWNPIDASTQKVAQSEFYVTCDSFEPENVNQYAVGDVLRKFYNDDGKRGIVVSTKGGRIYYVPKQQGNEFFAFIDSDYVSLENGTKVNQIKKTHTREINFNSSSLLIADYKDTAIIRNEGQIESFNFVLSF